MKTIKTTISDKQGNHLLVALDFCDYYYKHDSLNIPDEFADIDIVDISIEKVYLDKPISINVFFKLSKWLLHQFELNENAIFTYICSTDELTTNHIQIEPQEYRWKLFDTLLIKNQGKI